MLDIIQSVINRNDFFFVQLNAMEKSSRKLLKKKKCGGHLIRRKSKTFKTKRICIWNAFIWKTTAKVAIHAEKKRMTKKIHFAYPLLDPLQHAVTLKTKAKIEPKKRAAVRFCICIFYYCYWLFVSCSCSERTKFKHKKKNIWIKRREKKIITNLYIKHSRTLHKLSLVFGR